MKMAKVVIEVDPTKIVNELGWNPKYTFDSGIKETIEWNLQHEDWLKDVINSEYLKFMKEQYK